MKHSVFSIIVLSFLVSQLTADEILDTEFGVKKIAGDCRFTEGPAVGLDGNLYFSDGRNNRVMRWSPRGKVDVFRKPSGRANGLLFDHEGRLLMCQSSGEGGGRQVARLEKDGTETVMAGMYNGKKFIAPNDLCIDRRGRIYFTDPYYGPPAEKSQPTSGVYRIDAPGKVTLVIKNLQRPNGIVITPDNKFVYVSDRGTQKLHRYEVLDNGDLKPNGILYDFSPDRGIDGMCLDERGNVYGAAGKDETTGLFVISPKGKLLLHKPMPEFSTNVTFGGKDMRDLFFTATTSVYHMRTVTPGAKLPPKIAMNLPDTKSFHLFLLAGQSNMAGRGRISEEDRQLNPRVLMFTKDGKWAPAIDPLHFDKPTMVGVGLGRSFAKQVADANPDITIGLIPCAVGGSPIASWEPSGFHASTKSHPYDDAIRRTKQALKSGTLKGILWHQGESDSKPGRAEVYKEKLHALIARFRKEFAAPNVPFIAGQLGQFPDNPWNEEKKVVDSVHQSLPKAVDNCTFVSSDGLTHKGDKVHFDAKSYREFGKRYAKAYSALTNRTAK